MQIFDVPLSVPIFVFDFCTRMWYNVGMSKLSYADAAKLVNDYAEGASIKELAAKYSLWPSGVISRLTTAGIYKSPRPSSVPKSVTVQSTVADRSVVSAPPVRPARPVICYRCMEAPATIKVIDGKSIPFLCPECLRKNSIPYAPKGGL